MSKFDITSRLRAAVSRSDDPHLLIDMVREEQEQHLQRIITLERRVKALEDAERDRLTETGVLRTVRNEFSKREIDWMKWAARSVLAGIGTAVLGLAAWVVKLAWKGLAS